MSIRPKRINHDVPVEPIYLDGLETHIKDELQDIYQDPLDAHDKQKDVKRGGQGPIVINPKNVPQSPPPEKDVEKSGGSNFGGGSGGGGATGTALGAMSGGTITRLKKAAVDIECIDDEDPEVTIFGIATWIALKHKKCDIKELIIIIIIITIDFPLDVPPDPVLEIIKELGGPELVPGGCPDNEPDSTVDTFNPLDYSKDDQARLIARGYKPIKSKPKLSGKPWKDDNGVNITPKVKPYLDHMITDDDVLSLGEVDCLPKLFPPEMLKQTNVAVGIGLTESIKHHPTPAVIIPVLIAEPSWVQQYMPELPAVLVAHIRSDNPKIRKIITRDFLEHMDRIWPEWYTKSSPDNESMYSGLKEYYEACEVYLPNAECLSAPIRLTGAQKLKMFTGIFSPKRKRSKYPQILAAI